MRVKTDDRRRAIMGVAGEMFRQSGFKGASMSAISAALGGSKATLYGYFGSKEDLYEAVMMQMIEQQVESFFLILDHPSGDLRTQLLQFGAAYLAWMLSPDVVSVVRSGIEARDGGLGRRLFEHGPARCWRHVAGFLQQVMEAERLGSADPLVAALHLKGLLQAGLFEPFLFGAPLQLPRDVAVERAVNAFLRAYAPGNPSPTPRRRRKP